MNLRPHHILCIQKYTGHGYNTEFTEHMNSVVAELKNSPNTPVIVTEGCDELCGVCPNNSHGSCSSLDKVAAMDSSVLGICEFSYGQSASWAQLSTMVRERILCTDKFYSICSKCQWFELCRDTEVIYD